VLFVLSDKVRKRLTRLRKLGAVFRSPPTKSWQEFFDRDAQSRGLAG
jgi:hypothetical protein